MEKEADLYEQLRDRKVAEDDLATMVKDVANEMMAREKPQSSRVPKLGSLLHPAIPRQAFQDSFHHLVDPRPALFPPSP